MRFASPGPLSLPWHRLLAGSLWPMAAQVSGTFSAAFACGLYPRAPQCCIWPCTIKCQQPLHVSCWSCVTSQSKGSCPGCFLLGLFLKRTEQSLTPSDSEWSLLSSFQELPGILGLTALFMAQHRGRWWQRSACGRAESVLLRVETGAVARGLHGRWPLSHVRLPSRF